MRITAVQHDIVWLDRDANFERLSPMVAAAAADGADLILLSETFSTGFATDGSKVAEPPGGPSERFLQDQAVAHETWVGGTFPQNGDGPLPYNTFVLAGPDGTTHHYRKIHRFGYGGEDEVFGAGDRLVTVPIGDLRVTLFVCYDLRFADEFWQVALDTDVYLVPANWPAARSAHWRQLLIARAIENQAYVVGCNRVGSGDRLAYQGDSCIIDPLGDTLARGADEEMLVTTEVDAAEVAAVRERFPFLADRR
ncbi:MAG: nitrilase-related carbon-nitrogen hydrolase [Acidimicrobiales bacterium]